MKKQKTQQTTKLVLAAETLRTLDDKQLVQVAAGQSRTGNSCANCTTM